MCAAGATITGGFSGANKSAIEARFRPGGPPVRGTLGSCGDCNTYWMGVVMAKYSIFIRTDLTQVFWARMQAGDFISEAVELIDSSRRTGRRILAVAGGVRPRRGRDLKGRCLTFAEREDIAIRRAMG